MTPAFIYIYIYTVAVVKTYCYFFLWLSFYLCQLFSVMWPSFLQQQIRNITLTLSSNFYNPLEFMASFNGSFFLLSCCSQTQISKWDAERLKPCCTYEGDGGFFSFFIFHHMQLVFFSLVQDNCTGKDHLQIIYAQI